MDSCKPPIRNLSGLLSAVIAVEIGSMSAIRVRSRRHVASHVAVIAHEGLTMECVVADVSTGGARLTLRGSEAVPQRFELKVAGTEVVRRCDVVWRHRNEIGVRFLA